MTKTSNKLGLYIHIPYCLNKCPYCDFYSQGSGSCPGSFVQALETEITKRGQVLANAARGKPRLDSVYFGGGTPSLLSAAQFSGIMGTVRQVFDLETDCEVSLEANPGSLHSKRLAMYCEAGLNRLSLGVQSFNDRELHILGRMHDASDNHSAIKIIKEAGLANFSIDLIIGLPGQKLSHLNESLAQLKAVEPAHVSAYILQVEESTPMGRQIAAGQLRLPDDEDIAAMYYQVREVLCQAGYRHYEISNYAMPGRECRHNLRYWQARGYLGTGPGGVSLLGSSRIANQTPLDEYTAGSLCLVELENMAHDERAVDALILALRCIAGVDLEAFRARFGWDLTAMYQDEISRMIAEGWLKLEEGRLALSSQALILSNQVFLAFLP